LCRRSPESGGVWCTSRRLKKTVYFTSEGSRICRMQVVKASSNLLFQALDLYWRSPESGGVWYPSRQLKRTVCFPSEGSRICRVQVVPPENGSSSSPHLAPSPMAGAACEQHGRISWPDKWLKGDKWFKPPSPGRQTDQAHNLPQMAPAQNLRNLPGRVARRPQEPDAPEPWTLNPDP
jgi:hypothetical protein